MDPFVSYLSDGTLPIEIPSEIWRFKRKASQFVLMDKQLYKKSYAFPLLKCLGPTDADYVLREIHEKFAETTRGADLLSIRL